MATLPGWNIDTNSTIPVDVIADVSAGQVGKLTTENTADVAGAGDVPAGVFHENIDTTVKTGTELVTKNRAVCFVDAAVTDLTIPLTTAQLGRVTPATTNNQVLVGRPLTLQSTIGATVLVDLNILGTYYGI